MTRVYSIYNCVQDAYYLKAFKRAYEAARVAAATAGHSREVVEAFVSLSAGVDEELKMHKEYAAELAINLDEVTPLPACAAYCSFLDKEASAPLATPTSAAAKALKLCAATAPCMRLWVK